jgi:methylmalonyl-CoA mutase
MYVNQPWTIRQYAGFSTAKDSNAFYRRNLAAGQKGLSIAFDLATHRGYDSDNPRVAGDVGMAGVAIDSILDMRTAVRRHPAGQDERLDDHERRRAAGAGALHRGGRGAGRRHAQLTGTIQNDMLKEFMVRNTYIYPPEPSMQIISDIFALHLGGDAAVQLDLDLRLPHAGGRGDGRPRAGLHPRRRHGVPPRRARQTGLKSTRSPRGMSFFWAIGMNFFMEVAKLRAAACCGRSSSSTSTRRTPSRCRCAPTARRAAGRSPRRTSTTTSSARASRRWPPPRATPSRCTPTPWTRRSRCRPTSPPASPATPSCFLQQESGTTRVIDPWGGSYYVERLTAELAARAWEHIAEVEEAGGMTKAIEAGMPKLRIEEAAARTQARIDSGQQPVIGVNKYRRTSTRERRRAQGRQHRGAGRADRQARTLRAERDIRPACEAALAALTAAARAAGRRPPRAGAEPAEAVGRRRPRTRHGRRDERRARSRLRSPHRSHPHDLGGVPPRDG